MDRGIAEELEKRMKEVGEISTHLVPILEEGIVGWGKRLRAMLVILGYEMSGKEVDDEVIKAGVVMSYLFGPLDPR